jgi:Fe-S-cluster containining protein
MEFTIDFALVRKIVAAEGKQARADIDALGVLPAYRLSLQRHDARLASAADADTLACKSGCSWCCNFSIDVRPVEVLNILSFMQSKFSAEQLQQLRVEIEANSQLLSQLDDMQRMTHNIKCPFLIDHHCSIYAARPQTCRNYHATNAAGCQQSYEQPDNFDIEPEYAPLVYQAGAATVDAFSQAAQMAGYDIAAYELNSALAVALAEPEAVAQRFSSHLQAFTAIEATDVPMEFIDLDD